MTTAYDNTNRGALFKNDEKNEPDAPENWPDYKGQLNASGIEYWVSAWIKTSKKGQKFMSLSVVPKETKGAKGKAAAPADDVDEDVPF